MELFKCTSCGEPRALDPSWMCAGCSKKRLQAAQLRFEHLPDGTMLATDPDGSRWNVCPDCDNTWRYGVTDGVGHATDCVRARKPTQDQTAAGPSAFTKHDADKPRMDLLPPSAVEAVARVLTHGAKKYGDDNWRKGERHRYVAALLRHVFAAMRGERVDPESGESHWAHAACCALFLVELDHG